MEYLIQGLLLGLAYVAPIGTQNLYVINSALQGNLTRSLKVALIIVFFDISLALACFFGIGAIIEKFLILKQIILLVGGIAVGYIGIRLILSKPEVEKNVKVKKSLLKVISTSFAVTWFNPQAIIDGSLLFGAFRASLPSQYSTQFIIGVSIASLLWFTSLATIVSLLHKTFNKKVLRIINIVCGGIIVFYGIKLITSFVTMFL